MKIQSCCTKRGATALACAKIRAPRRRSEANEGMEDRGDCQQVGWKGSSGDYPGKDSIRVASGQVREQQGSKVVEYSTDVQRYSEL
jgi:hypothetical protein